jgi:hypothetical protein
MSYNESCVKSSSAAVALNQLTTYVEIHVGPRV